MAEEGPQASPELIDKVEFLCEKFEEVKELKDALKEFMRSTQESITSTNKKLERVERFMISTEQFMDSTQDRFIDLQGQGTTSGGTRIRTPPTFHEPQAHVPESGFPSEQPTGPPASTVRSVPAAFSLSLCFVM